MIARHGILGLWLACCSAAVASELVIFEPRDGFLLLRNGNVLSGRITPLGESYVVTFAHGGETRVPRTEVDFDCRSLEEGYLIKRDSLSSDDAKSHLQLASWCLQHDLLARAADQLLVARMQRDNDPVLPVLEGWLKTRASTPSAPTAGPYPVQSARPAAPLAPHALGVSPYLVQQFTTIIQPILFSRCANFACHGGGASQYRLIRPRLGQATTSHLTLRNLQATLAFIDRDQPQSSQLMVMAQQPHGKVATAIFHEKTGNHLSLLAAWVRRLDLSASRSDSDVSRDQTVMQRPVRIPPTSSDPPTTAGGDDDPAGARGNSQSTPASHTSSYVPRDPFDAEVFNRRYHGDRQRAPSSAP